jgi:hypothetical protein
VHCIPCEVGVQTRCRCHLPLHLKKKSCALPEADMQQPYMPKYGQGKTKIDLFRDFFTKIFYVQVMNFIPIKVSTLYNIISGEILLEKLYASLSHSHC